MRILSSREKLLLGVVLIVVFLVMNIVLGNFLIRRQAQLRADLQAKQAELEVMETLFADRELWMKRDEWLQQNQPALANEHSAGVQLLEHVRQIASGSAITIENPDIGTVNRTATHQAVSVTVDTKSSWRALVAFLHTLQEPNAFIVIEQATLRTDPADPGTIRGRFRIAKWFAPAA